MCPVSSSVVLGGAYAVVVLIGVPGWSIMLICDIYDVYILWVEAIIQIRCCCIHFAAGGVFCSLGRHAVSFVWKKTMGATM